MPLPDEFMPYGPPVTIIGLIRRCRERGLPDTLTPQELGRLNVPDGTVGRVSQTLRFLSLIDDDHNRTDKFAKIERATTDQYPNVLAEIIRAAYHSIFEYVDPAQDTDIAIGDQFRHYKPASVRDRMMALFIGLCAEAGIAGERERPAASIKTPTAARKSGASTKGAKDSNKSGDQASERPPLVDEHKNGSSYVDLSDRYTLLSALIQQLPKDGKWSKKRHDSWVAAMTANVDLLVETDDSNL